MLRNFSERTIAGSDISLNNFLKILIVLITDLETRTDIGTDCLVKLLDIDVDEIVVVKLPSQSKMICASG